MIVDLNQYVRIKLTKNGLDILKKAFDKDIKELKKVLIKRNRTAIRIKPWAEYLKELHYNNVDRTITIQLYEVMNIFGAYLVAGNTNPPIENYIEIM